MKKEIAAQWVEALRSGDYEKTTYCLRRDEDAVSKFDCLGVLCDISDVGEWVGEWVEPDIEAGGTIWSYRAKGMSEETLFPSAVIDWAGLNSDEGWMEKAGPYTEMSLTDLNDGCPEHAPMSFPELADVIEEYWQEL